jgi:anti-sigma regulatory factor (Ser/Thr protein kinase)
MFTVIRDRDYIAFAMASDPSYVHALIRYFEELAPDWGIGDSGRMAVVLRELLSNAITHGNRQDRSRNVSCRIERTPEGPFRITVEDEGTGFDFGCVNTTMPVDPRNVRRRGYILIRSICRSLHFNRRGNRVTVLVDQTENCGQMRQTAVEGGGALRR